MSLPVLVIILALSTLLLGVLFIKSLSKKRSLEKKYANLKEKYSGIIDVESEIKSAEHTKAIVLTDIETLRSDYKEKRTLLEKLIKEVAIYDEQIQLAELGFYKPHFDFDTSEQYKEKITSIKNAQKEMISQKSAIFCKTEWQVEGSKVKGSQMINRNIKLAARAFNNECDSVIANVRWNNVERMRLRIVKAYNAINKLNETQQIIISNDYFDLKMKELLLTYEYKEKKQQEKEEQAEIKRQMREDAKLEQEALKAQKEEEKFQKMLEKARTEAEKATGEKLSKLKEKIVSLDQELQEAHEKNERAKSMAQQTKSGHVYVISNIGSFGEDVYKIGMTRRLEPLDRVKELGDASVPFLFDVHAMIYSEDAPALENSLHKTFKSEQVNLVNSRKEFFNISLRDIEREVKKISPDAEFIETAEARQYRESMAIRAEREHANSIEEVLEELPLEI